MKFVEGTESINYFGPGIKKLRVFQRSAFIFSESSYFNLKFGIKQSKIS